CVPLDSVEAMTPSNRTTQRWSTGVAALAVAGLCLAGCGVMDDPGPGPGTDDPAETDGPAGAGTGDEGGGPQPVEVDAALERLAAGETIDVPEGEDEWQVVLEVTEQTFVVLDVRHEAWELDGVRGLVVEDAF